jgi:excisionase family DNA binding protein
VADRIVTHASEAALIRATRVEGRKGDVMAKKILTTGEVARLLGININTVIKWFDKGDIDGFRLPGSAERRIPLTGLVRFMATNGIPMDLLEEDTPMRRRHRRVGCSDQATFQVQNGRTFGPYPATLLDLSEGGARLQIGGKKPVSFPTGAFDLSLAFTEGDLAGSSFSARVAHLTPREESLEVGLQFLNLATADQARLNTYVTGHI